MGGKAHSGKGVKSRFDGLDAAAFESTFGMARADFATLPAWRQKAAKQKAGLF